jgi:hypothetical protein
MITKQFMHQELVEAIESYANRVGIKNGTMGGNPHSGVTLYCIGIKRFKQINSIEK